MTIVRYIGYMIIPENISNKSGVYAIVNHYNGKRYMGGTKSGFRQRLKYHLEDLKNGRHPNEYFQRAYNINPDSFEFKILKVCDNPWEIEQEHLDSADWDNLYNLCRDAIAPKTFCKGHTPWNKGMKMSKEHREKLSIAAKNRVTTKKGRKKRSESMRKSTDRVEVLTLKGEKLGEHRSIPDLCELDPHPYKEYMSLKNKNGRNGKDPYYLHEQSVRSVCNGNRDKYKGLLFRYK